MKSVKELEKEEKELKEEEKRLDKEEEVKALRKKVFEKKYKGFIGFLNRLMKK